MKVIHKMHIRGPLNYKLAMHLWHLIETCQGIVLVEYVSGIVFNVFMAINDRFCVYKLNDGIYISVQLKVMYYLVLIVLIITFTQFNLWYIQGVPKVDDISLGCAIWRMLKVKIQFLR